MQLVIRDARRLSEGGGVRFGVHIDGVGYDAFAVRWHGRLHAYLNVCRHESLPLDFGDARFFDEAYDALVCVQHGARYRPDTGVCFEGPCVGARLTTLSLVELDGAIWCAGRAAREEVRDEA